MLIDDGTFLETQNLPSRNLMLGTEQVNILVNQQVRSSKWYISFRPPHQNPHAQLLSPVRPTYPALVFWEEISKLLVSVDLEGTLG